jgi:hypothetical protein
VVQKNEHTDYVQDKYVINIVSIIILCAAVTFIKMKNIKINKRIVIITSIIWILLCIAWVAVTQFYPRADQKYVLSCAEQIRNGNFKSLKKGGYLFIYPHQYGIVLFYYLVGLVFNNNTYLAAQYINIVALVISFYSIYKTMSILVKKNEISKYIVLSLIAFLPISMYITFVYGNLLGLACSSIAMLFQIKYFEKEKIRYIFLTAFLASLAYLFKSNYLITVIAIILLFIAEAINKRKIKYLVPVAVVCAFYVLGIFLIGFTMKQITGIDKNKGVPTLSWVAMGMQEGEMAPGWYNGFNKTTYEENNYDSDFAGKIAEGEINHSLEEFKKNPKKAIKFYSKKIESEWNNPTFQGIWVNKSRKSDKAQLHITKSVLKNGFCGRMLTKYFNILQSIVLFGVICYIIIGFKEIKLKELLYAIVFIGGFIFHLIWEAKCQYTITYFVLLIPYFVIGYYKLGGKLEGYVLNYAKNNSNKKIILRLLNEKRRKKLWEK